MGGMLFNPIKICWVHKLGDAFEEDVRHINELERPDAEEGEGWGTIKVVRISSQCDLATIQFPMLLDMAEHAIPKSHGIILNIVNLDSLHHRLSTSN